MLRYVGHGPVVESTLNLVVGKFNEGVILLRQLVAENFVVFFAQCLLAFADQALAN